MTVHLAPDLRLVRADNPGPLTGTGTNTWLIGRGDVAVVDPGPALDSHLAAILAALDPGERISHILVTHTHLDHSALAPGLVAATGAVTAGFGRAFTGHSAVMQALTAQGLRDGGEGIDHSFAPDITLKDGEAITGNGWALSALHTPGHAANHLCFAWGQRLFSGDHVMGWSSSLVSPPDGDMADYMASLERLAGLPWHMACPGHGDPISNPAARIAALQAHRRLREAALMAALLPDGVRLGALTAAVYHDVPVAMHKAASRNVLAHVIDLHDRKLIGCSDMFSADPLIFKLPAFPS